VTAKEEQLEGPICRNVNTMLKDRGKRVWLTQAWAHLHLRNGFYRKGREEKYGWQGSSQRR
jgi:hypothetical protein